MLRHLPVVVVVAPFVAAPLCIIFRHFMPARLLALGVAVFILVCASVMLEQATQGFVWRYEFGGWPAPWGISYRVDLLGALIVLLLAVIASAVALFCSRPVVHEFADEGGCFFALFLLCLSGLLGITVTNDLFNVFVFLEVSALSSYALIGLGRGGHPPLAAYRYLVMGAIGATFFLIGIGYLYMMTGTLNLDDLALRVHDVADSRVVAAAFAFISAGLAMKMALFPLHWWLPDAYTFAPSPVSALLAAASTKVAIYLLIRLFFGVFSANFAFEDTGFDTVLLLLSLAAILVTSTIAIYQDDIKRMMAYSSVSQVGYITLGLSLVSASGVGAGLIYLFNHALIKGGLFLALGCVVYRVGGCGIELFAGLGRRMPWTMGAIVIGGLSLVGVPLTAGFIGKWKLIEAVIASGPGFGTAFLVVAILAGSLLAAVYVWRLIEIAYMRPSPAGAGDERCEAPAALLVPVWILIALNVYIGFNSDGLVTVAMEAARDVFDPVGILRGEEW